MLLALGCLLFPQGLARVQKVYWSLVENANSFLLRCQLGLKKFISLCDEVRHFDLEVWPDDLRSVRVKLLRGLLLSIVRVNVVVELADEGLGHILLGDHLLDARILEDLDLF